MSHELTCLLLYDFGQCSTYHAALWVRKAAKKGKREMKNTID